MVVGSLIALWSVIAIALVLFDLIAVGGIVGVFALSLALLAVLARP